VERTIIIVVWLYYWESKINFDSEGENVNETVQVSGKDESVNYEANDP
jgi:hypothetical protein